MNISVDTETLRVADEGAAMLQRVESLHPLLRANTGKALEDRRVPVENIDALKKAGFFLALQPARWGGYELNPQDFFRIQMSIGELRSWIPGLKRMYGGKTFILGSRLLMRRWARLKTRTVVFDSVAAGAGAAGVITVLGCCWAAFYRTARTVHSSFPRAITVLKTHGIPWASRVLDPTTLWWKMFLCLITAPINKPMGLKGLTPE